MYPLLFRPILKRIVWGGRRLGDLLGKPIGTQSDYAESWEIVDHGDDQSVVENGPLAGTTLGQLIREHNVPLLGRHAGLDAFPLLLKYLDCNRVLSVQVHPDDAYAQRMPQPDLGKTEAWYILDAQPESRIYAGLKAGVDRQALQQAIQAGQTDQVLHAFTPQVGQCVFIPAGTVHALGGGLVVAEIQQSSDTTFRLFDWNRVGDDGQPRPLHIQQALDVTDFDRGPVAVQQPAREPDGSETLVSCDKFVLRQVRLSRSPRSQNLSEKGSDPLRRGQKRHENDSPPKGQTPFRIGSQPQDAAQQSAAAIATITIGGDQRMQLLSVVHGEAEIRCAAGPPLVVPRGRSVLIPAAAGAATLQTLRMDTTVLVAHLP